MFKSVPSMYDDGQKYTSIGQQSPCWPIAICGFNYLFAPKNASGKNCKNLALKRFEILPHKKNLIFYP